MISGGQIQSFSLFAIVDSGQQSEGFPVFLSQSVYFFFEVANPSFQPRIGSPG